MFGRSKEMSALRLKNEEQARQLSEYSDVLRSLASYAGIANFAPSGLVAPRLAEEKLRLFMLPGNGNVGDPAKSVPGTESRPVSTNVRKLNLAGVMDVLIRQGAVPSLTLSCGDGRALAKTITRITGDTLTLDTEPTIIIGHGNGSNQVIVGNGNVQISRGNSSIQIGRLFGQVISGDKVVNHGPQYVGVSGNSDGSAASAVSAVLVLPSLRDIRITGYGNITYLDCQQDCMDIDITGSGSVDVKGAVQRLDGVISGSGSISARGLVAKALNLRISGSGEMDVFAVESVRARVSGSGKIKVSGNPVQRDTNVSGSGKIKFL